MRLLWRKSDICGEKVKNAGEKNKINPFSSKKQAQIVRQENDLTEDDWQRRRDQIMAEHRLDGARDQLRTQWKAWINQNVSKADSQAEPRSPATAKAISEFDE